MTTTTAAQSRFGASAGRAPGAADDKAAKAEEDGKKKGAGNKKALFKSKKFIVVLVAVLAAGFGAYKTLMPTKVGPPTGGDVVAMDATTLNLAGGHYLKVAISIQLVAGKATAADFPTSHAAQITIDQFSNRTVGSLSSNRARQRLLDSLLLKLKAAYPGEVYDAFVTEFVTQ
jgi:flagellar FliL protein